MDSQERTAKPADPEEDVLLDPGEATRQDTFDRPVGTRGARRGGRLERWMDTKLDAVGGTRIGRRLYRRLMGCDSLVLTTIGRRSGVERRVRLAWFPSRDGGWLIVAAAGGTAANPAWYHNLAARPDEARIEVDGRTVAVTGEQLHGEVRAEAWAQVVETSPQFGRFQRKTDRRIPVIRLTPRTTAR